MVNAPVPRARDEDAPVSELSRTQLLEVLHDTINDLERLDLSLEQEGVAESRRLRDSLVGQIRDHVIPRLQDADVPAIVVVGGSTGAGKSTLVNSVLGEELSDAGVLRPTTRVPVLVVNPEDLESLRSHPLNEACRTVASASVPEGLALVDASDLDSVHEANRALAVRLLDAADLWLFVTTAARYGDQTPWSSLEEAAKRQTPIGVVLNRVPAKVLPEVRRDLVSRLEGLGLAESPFFVVPDAGPHEGLLSAEAVGEIREWLYLLAGRHRAAGLVRRGGRSLWAALRHDLRALADGVDAQADAADALESACQYILETPKADLRRGLEQGEAGDGAPTTRWLALASSGGPLAALAQGGALRRGWFGRTAKARSAALARLAQDCRESLVTRLEGALVSVSDDVARCWRQAGVSERMNEHLPALEDPRAVVDAWGVSLVSVSTAVSGLSQEDVAALVQAAAAGVSGAEGAAARLGLQEAVASARASLAEALDGALARTVPEGSAASLAPDPALAAALRLRAGELAPFARPGDDS